ncbi:MAG: hypothetical protein ABH803_03390 [Candidatus Micrarchaeota archaeon]
MSLIKLFSVLCVGLLLFGCTSTPSTPNASNQATATPETGGDDFTSIMQKATIVEYKADYDITTVAGGQTSTMTTTEAFKSGKIKMESTIQGQTTITLMMNNKIYICTNDLCFENEIEATSQSLDQQIQANPEGYTIISKPARTIAGITGNCFSLTSAETTGIESCYSSEGALLHMETSDGSFTKTATSVQIGSVSDSEFELPAEPTTLPSIPTLP